MPQIETQHVTTHTVTLTSTELESLREAARIALSTTEVNPFVKDWQAFAKLGAPATRGGRDTSFVDEYTNLAMIGPGD